MYQIENSVGTYEIIYIEGKPIYIFEKHNMAFPAWGTVSSRKNHPYILITFDYHTDTRAPFSKVKATGEYDYEWIKSLKVSHNEFIFQDAFGLAIEMIAHDEQIKTACKYGYLQQYFVICSENEDECISAGNTDQDEGYHATYINKFGIDAFLDDFLPKLENSHVIVDFDLDFFNSVSELDKKFFEKIAPILKNADAITIAREKWHFEDLRESSDFSHEKAIELLLEGLKSVM